jgi:hypothetical protein
VIETVRTGESFPAKCRRTGFRRVFSNELLNANDQPGTGDNSVLRIVNEASGTVSGVRLPA